MMTRSNPTTQFVDQMATRSRPAAIVLHGGSRRRPIYQSPFVDLHHRSRTFRNKHSAGQAARSAWWVIGNATQHDACMRKFQLPAHIGISIARDSTQHKEALGVVASSLLRVSHDPDV